MAITKLYIFRHGETDWNLEKRFQGHTDIPLNNSGRQQAEILRSHLEFCQLQMMVSSDLQRARVTAEIANLNMAVRILVTDQLRECTLGECEGMLRSDVILKYGEGYWQRWVSVGPEDKDFSFPGGESKSAHLIRMRNYLESFCRENPSVERLGVSTHGGSMRRLVHHCEGAPNEPVPMQNCVLYKLEFHQDTGRWIYRGAVT